MITQTYETREIRDHLASAIGVDSSRLLVGEEKLVGSGNSSLLKVPLILDDREIAISRSRPDSGVYSVNLKLPSSIDRASHAPFSREAIGEFHVVYFEATYDIDRHPEFRELLRDLRENKRMPGQIISHANEPSIQTLKDGRLNGRMIYRLGDPEKDGLCVQVEPYHLKYVPEAKGQMDRGHYCIHGETAPYNPFDTNPKDATELSVVQIVLGDRSNYGYLDDFLGGLQVPSDGLKMQVWDGTTNATIRLRTPDEQFIDILLSNIKSSESWDNKVALARKLEEMFKAD